jgi:hypothetical protein
MAQGALGLAEFALCRMQAGQVAPVLDRLRRSDGCFHQLSATSWIFCGTGPPQHTVQNATHAHAAHRARCNSEGA